MLKLPLQTCRIRKSLDTLQKEDVQTGREISSPEDNPTSTTTQSSEVSSSGSSEDEDSDDEQPVIEINNYPLVNDLLDRFMRARLQADPSANNTRNTLAKMKWDIDFFLILF
ncbi:unnamed protein product [Gongylonema pulchrum]|uniref:Uncharacterized protein n=1 Tax=Gongylonema pulchrum TaxID=637853 RepID=A0A183DLT1_9BILA|nr:unnamed protein product [Gongylonema pulchrum]